MADIILNCDLGENEPLARTAQFLSLIDAANIACGVHAGNPEKTQATIKLALQYQVAIGIHPGLPSAGGRGPCSLTAHEFKRLLEVQVGAFQALAARLGTCAEYVKLHGSLYHAVETQPALATVYIDFLLRQSPKLAVMALAHGRLAARAEAAGIRVLHEAFADRDYLSDGSLVPRDEPGAVFTAPEACARLTRWQQSGKWPTRDGAAISLLADTLCVHGDSPDALELVQKLRTWIDHTK
ncbi:LamB/YcsF family protein [Coraliomargarita sp. SDUM461004]|uniref:LamB/YcsF family protein n=1 Tax=Thalassobacterium sedimentorum TaxID=3041258 RepID=A0ABU1AGA4_9BACT|nr:5-oxoprolinase subunit PxpA [Coraliomargarita sp. SDUM461004]MDQ8193831.1 LamB/YcsF family protein [Coraliomargarita sp. SDUM461004]